MFEKMDNMFKNKKNYHVLKTTFDIFWKTNDLTKMEGSEKEKAFLLYVKGVADGMIFVRDGKLAKNN